MSLFRNNYKKRLSQLLNIGYRGGCGYSADKSNTRSGFLHFRRRLCLENLETRQLLAFSTLADIGPELGSGTQPPFHYGSHFEVDSQAVQNQTIQSAITAQSTHNFDNWRIPHFHGSQSILSASSDPSPGKLQWDPIQAEVRQRELLDRSAGNENYIVDDTGVIVGINPFTLATKDADGKNRDDDSEITRLNPFSPEETFLLNSLPGASKTIYLDFNGHTTSGTLWNSQFNGGNSIVTPAFNFEGSPDTFTNNELFRIQRIWERVAEDFLPFHVNVTTQEPPLNDLRRSGSSDTRWGIRVVIGPNTGWFSNAGGVAYIGSFNWSSDTPTFVFSNALGNSEKNIAEAISHEVGHTLGLLHDGVTGNDYYFGHGSGETGWAPIMGVGYSRQLVQWSRGEYPGATNTEDDLLIITTQNGFSYRADDHGNTIATATPLNVVDSIGSAEGIIERNTDVDFFTFTTGGGNVSINIDPFYRSPNLDILAKLYDSAGSLIASSNPVNSLSASFSLVLQSGTYFLSVEGTGKPTSGNDFGYSDYGSLGFYSILASVPQETGSLIAASYVYHPNSVFSSDGVAAALDSAKTLAREGPEPLTLTLDNLLNSSRGINGIVFDIQGLPTSALSPSDFLFQVSPQGAFNTAAHPPVDWQAAPVLPSISVMGGAVDRIVLQWPDGAISNRWLRITVKANANTGLMQPATYYIGHLLGETTGPVNDVYSVSFADISLIRSAVGQTVDPGSLYDIDKNGLVSFADISAMRGNVGAQLSNITIPAFGSGLLFSLPGDSNTTGSGGSKFASPPVQKPASSFFTSNDRPVTANGYNSLGSLNFPSVGALADSRSISDRLAEVRNFPLSTEKVEQLSSTRSSLSDAAAMFADARLSEVVSKDQESSFVLSVDEFFSQLTLFPQETGPGG